MRYYPTTDLNIRGAEINLGQQVAREENDLGTIEAGKLADLAVPHGRRLQRRRRPDDPLGAHRRGLIASPGAGRPHVPRSHGRLDLAARRAAHVPRRRLA